MAYALILLAAVALVARPGTFRGLAGCLVMLVQLAIGIGMVWLMFSILGSLHH